MQASVLTRTRTRLVAFLAIAGLLVAGTAHAASNIGTGDVGGDSAALIDSNPPLVLNSTGVPLALVKRAFLDDGVPTPVPSGSNLPAGTVLKFLVYINNDTLIDVHDIELRDVLDTGAFAYQADSIKLDNSVADCAAAACTPAEEVVIFTTVDGTAAGTDAVDPLTDVVSHVAGTIDAKSGGAGEVQNDAAGGRVWALSFTVTVK